MLLLNRPHLWLLWTMLHIALAASLVLLFVDRFELTDQMTMSENCDAWLKSVDHRFGSEVLFAVKCWSLRDAIAYFGAAIIVVGTLLSPITFAFCRRTRPHV